MIGTPPLLKRRKTCGDPEAEAVTLRTKTATGYSRSRDQAMAIKFDNDYTKRWLARKGPAKVFGKDVDAREQLSDDDAVAWFDRVWTASLQRAVQEASSCDI